MTFPGGKPGAMARLLALQELAKELAALRKKGKTVVHCHGVFDLLHPGHVRHLQIAKKEGDVLVVTLTPDRYVNKGPGRPVFPEELRADTLASLAMVDFVAVNEWPTATETIRLLQPNVYVKGEEYEKAEDDLTGKIQEEVDAVRSVGGRVHFTRDITFSSTKILNEHFPLVPADAKTYLTSFREKYDAKTVIDRLKSLHGMKVLVIGDAIIDEYHFCSVLGRASKAPSLNARYVAEEAHAGGAVAVANHLAGVCDKVDVITCLGAKNDRKDFFTEKLLPNVTPTFLSRPDGPTTVKRRFLHTFGNQRLFEVTFVEDTPLPDSTDRELQKILQETLQKYDMVLVADFGHGLLNAEAVSLLSQKAAFLALNVQVNSTNMGFSRITKYPKADYLCIDQEEMRFAYEDRFGPLKELIRSAAGQFHASTVTVTCGDAGSVTYQPDAGFAQTPVFSRQLVDATGAGDAYLALTAPCAAAGFPAELIGFVGNATGALAVQVLGNKEPVASVSLFKYIDALLK